MNYLFTKYIAEYNCGAYGASAYNTSEVCSATTTTTGGGTSNTSGGDLAKTGLDVAVPLASGLLLISVAVALFVRNIRRQRATS